MRGARGLSIVMMVPNEQAAITSTVTDATTICLDVASIRGADDDVGGDLYDALLLQLLRWHSLQLCGWKARVCTKACVKERTVTLDHVCSENVCNPQPELFIRNEAWRCSD